MCGGYEVGGKAGQDIKAGFSRQLQSVSQSVSQLLLGVSRLRKLVAVEMAKGRTLEKINRCIDRVAEKCRGKVYSNTNSILSL